MPAESPEPNPCATDAPTSPPVAAALSPLVTAEAIAESTTLSPVRLTFPRTSLPPVEITELTSAVPTSPPGYRD